MHHKGLAHVAVHKLDDDNVDDNDSNDSKGGKS